MEYFENPFEDQRKVENYEKDLRKPLIRTIRSQEAAALKRFFEEHLGKKDTVLEVGAGTGYYTLYIAQKTKLVTALEPIPAMSAILQEKLQTNGIGNVSIVNSDLQSYEAPGKFNHVVAIGVLDYAKDWKNFLERCLSLAEKTVIITLPHRGALGRIYAAIAGKDGAHIYLREKTEVTDFLQDHQVLAEEVGLASPFTKGMTLAVLVKKKLT